MATLPTIVAIVLCLGASVWLADFGLPKPLDRRPPTKRYNRRGRLPDNPRLRYVHSNYHAVLISLCMLFSHNATADDQQQCPAYQKAMADCMNIKPGYDNFYLNQAGEASSSCVYRPSPQRIALQYVEKDGSPGPEVWAENFSGCKPDAPNPCLEHPPAQPSGGFSGKYLAGYSVCGRVDAGGGANIQCSWKFTPSGPPTVNQWGSWHTPGTLSATGDQCGGSSGDGTTPKVKDRAGNDAKPAPPNPQDNPPVTPASQACGGGSCYDPNNDKFCATSGGQQFCVGGGDARGDQGGANAGTSTGNDPGSCSYSADSAICAGSPSAPVPSKSSASNQGGGIPNPNIGITSVDNYTQANPQTGETKNVQVTTYTNPGGASTKSGQKTGDSGPASSSSAGGQGDCKPGDACNDKWSDAPCDADPVASGDQLLVGALTELHRIRCKDGAGAKSSDFDGQDHTNGTENVNSADQLFKDGGTEDGNSGSGMLDALDSVGFLGGGRACPGIPPIDYFGQKLDPGKGICDTGSILAAYVLAAAYAVGAIIIIRGKAT